MAETQGDNNKLIEGLTLQELRAMEYKFEGYEYKEIKEKLEEEFGTSPAVQTIKDWFYKQGRLYGFYQAYKEEQFKIREKEAKEVFRAHVKNAVRTLVQVMAKSKLDLAKIKAAEDILNRVLGEPVKRVQGVGDNPARKILIDAGIIEDDGKEDTEID